MAKPKLVSTGPLTLHSDWLAPIVTDLFELAIWDPTDHYSNRDCYYTNDWDSIAIQWTESGRKIVLDMLWEPAAQVNNDRPCHILQNWNWFWYQESLWYRHLDYHHYNPQPNWTHHALMPIRLEKKHRNYVVKYIGDQIDRFIWSYQAQGRHLPGSGDFNDWNTQRQFVSDWYDKTAISLVLETSVSDRPGRAFISEKTFKPIAFKHPFVVCGDIHTLQYLHKLGFETFENLFDESYDQQPFWMERCKTAVNQCLQYKPYQNCRDKLTQDKLDHNHAHFFDQDLVTQKISQEILEPLLHYAET